MVGVLLITAMLIVPAAAARAFARTPEAMAVGAAVLGAASAAGGLWGSWRFDTPTGPSIVVAAVVALVACNAVAPLAGAAGGAATGAGATQASAGPSSSSPGRGAGRARSSSR